MAARALSSSVRSVERCFLNTVNRTTRRSPGKKNVTRHPPEVEAQLEQPIAERT